MVKAQGANMNMADSNLPSSGQRSLKSIKARPVKPQQQNFMLIYEENGKAGVAPADRRKSGEFQLYQSNQQEKDHKIVNVSFNDFNQSLDANLETSLDQAEAGKINPA